MSNKNAPKFEIPGVLIFIGFCINPVIGIILAVLRSVTKNIVISPKPRRSTGGNPYYHTRMEDDREDRTTEVRTAKTVKAAPKQKKKKSSLAYKLMITGTVVSLVIANIAGIAIALSSLPFPTMLRTFAASAVPFILLAICFFIGSKQVKKRDVRFDRIRAVIGNRQSLNLTKLATASNESLNQVRKDLQKLIDNGEFGDMAYIDLGTNNFMRTPDATPDDPEQFDYRKVYGKVFQNEGKDSGQQSEPQATAKFDGNATDRENFDTILREIRRLNDEIKDNEVSDRIYKIESHTKNIFDYVTDHPDSMPQIRTFMNYYLPTTLKLLESYSRIERVGVAGENMKRSKENIEKTLDMLVVGFEGQIDQLFKNESIDISSDISVLETMMNKDGIGGNSSYDISSMMDSYSDEISDDLSGGAAKKAK